MMYQRRLTPMPNIPASSNKAALGSGTPIEAESPPDPLVLPKRALHEF
jgi:hypothetical protein